MTKKKTVLTVVLLTMFSAITIYAESEAKERCVEPDHYLAYPYPLTRGLPTDSFGLTDQFTTGTFSFATLPRGLLLNPATKWHDGKRSDPVRPHTHYLSALITSTAFVTDFFPVSVFNQFGNYSFSEDDFSPVGYRLLVPSLKRACPEGDCNLQATASCPGCFPEGDHYLCYDLLDQSEVCSTKARFKDQFITKRVVESLVPTRFCNPVTKVFNGQSFVANNVDTNHLLCYSIEDKNISPRLVDVLNQFGEQSGLVRENNEVCVPSTAFAVPIVALALSKVADDAALAGITPGQIITYTFTVSNQGNVALNNVIVTDPLVGLSAIDCGGGSNIIPILLPEAEQVCTATYTVTPGDVTAGGVSNVATATASAVGIDVEASDGEVTPAPAIQITKTADETSLDGIALDQEVTYTFTVTNNGFVTLNNVAVTDPLPNLTSIDCVSGSNIIGTLNVGQVAVCTATYTITAADVTAGSVTNTATATGNPPVGPSISDQGSVTIPAQAVNLCVPFNNVTVTANPNTFTISGLANTIDGGFAGVVFGRIFSGAGDATGVVIDYTYTAPTSGITALRLHNNGGGILSDRDGIGTALVEVFDPVDTLLFSGNLNAGNGGAPFDTVLPGTLANVARVRISTITNLTGNPAPDIIWRELCPIQNF